ncbi:MAG: FAD-dependent oxidoreductase [Rhodobacteraceae bacterium]|nr:FAD-dependent oxidoreductase [Paracoccaceae bacterium]
MSQNVIVIGGGIIGLTIAQRLAENGFRITVLERDLAGLGASVRSAGLHFPVGRSTRVRSMTRFSQAHYEHRMGAIDRMRPLPMRVHMSEAAVERILPWFLPEAEMTRLPGPGGLVAPVSGLTSWAAQGAHHTDVGAYTAHLFQSMPPGVERREGCRVTELRDMAGGVEVGLADGTELHADHAVLAPGPWFGGAEFRPLTAGWAPRQAHRRLSHRRGARGDRRGGVFRRGRRLSPSAGLGAALALLLHLRGVGRDARRGGPGPERRAPQGGLGNPVVLRPRLGRQSERGPRVLRRLQRGSQACHPASGRARKRHLRGWRERRGLSPCPVHRRTHRYPD